MTFVNLRAGFVRTLLLAAIAVAMSRAQIPSSLTVEWIQGPESASVAATPAFTWLNNNTCVLYDRRLPEAGLKRILSIQHDARFLETEPLKRSHHTRVPFHKDNQS